MYALRSFDVPEVVVAIPQQFEGANGSAAAQVGASITEIDTSDWVTYRNEEHGFEVKYPDTYSFLLESIDQVNMERILFMDSTFVKGESYNTVRFSAVEIRKNNTFLEAVAGCENIDDGINISGVQIINSCSYLQAGYKGELHRFLHDNNSYGLKVFYDQETQRSSPFISTHIEMEIIKSFKLLD